MVAPGDKSENQRAAPRQKVLKSAKIILDDWTAMECAVRDISDTGAKIMVDDTSKVPDTFRLLMTTEHSIRPVKVARRSSDRLGILFTGPATRAHLRKF